MIKRNREDLSAQTVVLFGHPSRSRPSLDTKQMHNLGKHEPSHQLQPADIQISSQQHLEGADTGSQTRGGGGGGRGGGGVMSVPCMMP